LLKENKVTPDLEKQFGMDKVQMEQFVKKFEKRKNAPPVGPGRDIKVKPGATERAFDPNRKAPEGLPNVAVSKSNERQGADNRNDDLRGLTEGSQVVAPKALRSRFDAYRSSLGRTTLGPRRDAGASSAPTGNPPPSN
jgi:hypothetical protein